MTSSREKMKDAGYRLHLFLVQVFNGNPWDMILQGLSAALAALLSVWVEVNPFVGIYVALVVIDTILGVRKCHKDGEVFRWSRLLWGPGEKIFFAALVLMASQYMAEFVGNWITRSVAAYISMVLFLEAIGKYDHLSGTGVLLLIRDKVRTVVSADRQRTSDNVFGGSHVFGKTSTKEQE